MHAYYTLIASDERRDDMTLLILGTWTLIGVALYRVLCAWM
jgi:hypothetical protein